MLRRDSSISTKSEDLKVELLAGESSCQAASDPSPERPEKNRKKARGVFGAGVSDGSY